MAFGPGLLSQGPGLASGLWRSPVSSCTPGFLPFPCPGQIPHPSLVTEPALGKSWRSITSSSSQFGPLTMNEATDRVRTHTHPSVYNLYHSYIPGKCGRINNVFYDCKIYEPCEMISLVPHIGNAPSWEEPDCMGFGSHSQEQTIGFGF